MHGPRLNRYALNWAFYLGHHWAYRNAAGEPQLTFNYVSALARFINNFTFGRGVHFQTDKKFQHIVPALLKRVWEKDNVKESVLLEMGEQGGISGDAFIKIAYEPAWTDPAGNEHPGRVRILPINSAFAFPEYHPHDRERLVRFKMKYRFWGTSAEGTRSVYTYVEILTEDKIDEYINDELISSRPNPLGMIPIVHIPNIPVSGSPWGLSDVNDIITLNREYNEKATDVSDIINYHAAPVTVIAGAKISNLEKGPKKIWGGLPKDANVFTLENGVDLNGPLAYMELLKRAMHEMTGVPETALGQVQPVSNTSGVALSIQYIPMIQRYNRKINQYTWGLRKINELILRTLFVCEPDSLKYDPETDGLKNDVEQADELDPADSDLYIVDCIWPPPLPVDVLVKLNEIQAKMLLGLESKRGALRDLGEEFPDEKVEEIFREQLQDAREQGALDMLKAQISSAIMQKTGLTPEAGGEPIEPQSGPGAGQGQTGAGPMPGLPALKPDADNQQMLNELVTMAYGTKLAQRRNSENDSDSS